MKYLYVLASLFVLTACATGGPKYSGSGITTDPILESNRKVTYMTDHFTTDADAVSYVKQRLGLIERIGTEDTKEINKKTYDIFTNLYKLQTTENFSFDGLTYAYIMDMYRVAGNNCDKTETNACYKKTDGDTELKKLSIDEMKNTLNNQKDEILQIYKKYYDVDSDKKILASKKISIDQVKFNMLESDPNTNFTYILDNSNKTKLIKGIKIGETEYSRQDDTNTFVASEKPSVTIDSAVKDLDGRRGLFFADLGTITMGDEHHVYFGDYESKRIENNENAVFYAKNSKQIDTTKTNPEFSGKAVVEMYKGENDKYIDNSAEAKLILYTVPESKASKLTINTKNNDKIVVEGNTKLNFNTVTVNGDDWTLNTAKAHFYGSGNYIIEAAGTVNAIKGAHHFNSAFGVKINDKQN